jgi:hypothetical protein
VNRRTLLTYVAPAIVTLAVIPQIASAGSVITTNGSTTNAGSPPAAAKDPQLCVDGDIPEHGCKKVLRQHRFDD